MAEKKNASPTSRPTGRVGGALLAALLLFVFYRSKKNDLPVQHFGEAKTKNVNSKAPTGFPEDLSSASWDIVNFNRQTLRGVPNWITDEDWNSAISFYGLPHHLRPVIDSPISDDIIEADILCEYLRPVLKPRYLEIGVSVGKTFFTIIQCATKHLQKDARLSALDIEATNPTLKTMLNTEFGPGTKQTFANAAPAGSPRASLENSVTSWAKGKVMYYEADEYDSGVWSKLEGPFDLVMSDALHTADAIKSEFNFLLKNQLFNPDGFAYCFDDIEGEMVAAWNGIVQDLPSKFPDLEFRSELAHPNGWVGQHEKKHAFGIIVGRKR